MAASAGVTLGFVCSLRSTAVFGFDLWLGGVALWEMEDRFVFIGRVAGFSLSSSSPSSSDEEDSYKRASDAISVIRRRVDMMKHMAIKVILTRSKFGFMLIEEFFP